MPDTNLIEWIRHKYLAIVTDLDERGRRRWAAAEARSLGRGGVTTVLPHHPELAGHSAGDTGDRGESDRLHDNARGAGSRASAH